MTELVPTDDIERIVGTYRRYVTHYGRAVSAEQKVYILHSRVCLDSGQDLRECRFSKALDLGIDMDWWDGHEDEALALAICWDGRLVPLKELCR